MAFLLPETSHLLMITFFLWSVVMILNNSISHLAWSSFMTVSVIFTAMFTSIFTSMLSSFKAFLKPDQICWEYEPAICWCIHYFIQPLTNIKCSSGCKKWVMLLGTFTNRIFFSVNICWVICFRKIPRINIAENFPSNRNSFF